MTPLTFPRPVTAGGPWSWLVVLLALLVLATAMFLTPGAPPAGPSVPATPPSGTTWHGEREDQGESRSTTQPSPARR